MNHQNKHPRLLITLWSYALTGFLGWQIFNFIDVFFQLNQERIKFSFQNWLDTQQIYIPIASFIIIILSILLVKNKSIKNKTFPIYYKAFNWILIWLLFLFILSALNSFLFQSGNQQNIIELINLILATMILIQLGRLFYIKNNLVWFHPTTQSTFYIAAALLGISQMLILDTLDPPSKNYAYFLLVLLVLETLRIVSRFRYLTKATYQTNSIARMMLGRFGIYFGIRIVAGIFMPMVYILYALYTDVNLYQGVGALLIIGEFFERLLFVFLTDTS